jgi:hypothetical protein
VTALPPTLVQFGGELETAIARELARRRTSRRALALRLAAMGTAAAIVVVAAGVTRELTGRGPSVVERAAAALTVPAGSILHVRMVATQDNGDGTSVSWEDESWQGTFAPRPRRQIERVGGGAPAESETSGNGSVGIYDAARNTIYLARESELVEGVQPKSMPKPVLTPGPKGEPRRAWKIEGGAASPSARRWDDDGAAGEPLQIDASAESFRKQVLGLLESGRGRIERDVHVGGRAAVRITFRKGRVSYLVDAATYAPIQLRTSGTLGSVVLRFPVYEVLPATDENRALLSVVAQHPDARVVRDVDQFRAAQARLFPNG